MTSARQAPYNRRVPRPLKTEKVMIRMSPEDKALLGQLADQRDMTHAALIRSLLKAAYEEDKKKETR